MMNSIQWIAKSINIKLFASCILGLTLIANPPVLAVYEPGTQKPVPADRRSDAGTTRGCAGDNMPLTILASRNYVGRTISRHPTLAWFVPRDSASKPIELKLYEWVPGGRAKEVRKMSLQSSPGVMTLSPFSANEPGLQPGKEYSWQVVIHCNPDSPTTALVSEASLEVIEMPATMQSKLNKATNSGEKANIYAEAGVWYNAMEEALNLAEASKLGDVGSNLLNDLAKSEAPKNLPKLLPKERGTIEKQVENLQQIARKAR